MAIEEITDENQLKTLDNIEKRNLSDEESFPES